MGYFNDLWFEVKSILKKDKDGDRTGDIIDIIYRELKNNENKQWTVVQLEDKIRRQREVINQLTDTYEKAKEKANDLRKLGAVIYNPTTKEVEISKFTGLGDMIEIIKGLVSHIRECSGIDIEIGGNKINEQIRNNSGRSCGTDDSYCYGCPDYTCSYNPSSKERRNSKTDDGPNTTTTNRRGK